jgi:multidrug efflux pump subunit AcrB
VNLTSFAIENKVFTQFVVFLLVVGGLLSYQTLGRLEDPDFTVKTGVIVTQYPGASPEEVELEVTDRIERALQEMPQLDKIYSISRAGLSIVQVDMRQNFWADTLPQVWDEMRKKIRDVLPGMPPGVLHPEIVDDFSFVFGFVLAVTGDGYDYAELEEHVKTMKKELSLVPGVARVELWGSQPRVVYLDVSESQLSELQITTEDILATLALQNMVVAGGNVEVSGKRLRIEASGEFSSPEDIGDLVIRRSVQDIGDNFVSQYTLRGDSLAEMLPMATAASGSAPTTASGELIRLRDVATVREGYLEPAITKMRFDGQPSLGIQLANVPGGNLLVTGAALDERIAELRASLPAGINIEKFSWQSDLVRESINGFVVNLAEAVLIVLAVLTLAMGWRMGVVIGWALVVTIFGTFIAMKLLHIDLQRVSLGALVVALGMMVDNAIVVADNYTIRINKGMKPLEAAIESAAKPSIALLGATVVAAMAFYPVFAAITDAGEYGRTLFVVVAVALMLSWLISMTVTPLNCMALLRPTQQAEEGGEVDPYNSGFYRFYKRVLEGAIKRRGLTVTSLTALLLLAIYGFTTVVPLQFFPKSTRSQLMIDYWGPMGTPIEVVSNDMAEIEKMLIGDERVLNVGAFVGAGGPRFYLPVNPEFPWAEYGQIIINTPDYDSVVSLIEEFEPKLKEQFPQAMIRVRMYTVGPGDTWPFEFRIAGPAEADLAELRRLGEEGKAILRDSPYATHIRTDMRDPVQKIVARVDQERARWAGVSRASIGEATRRAFDGTPVGLYREGDTTLPIIVRNTDEERARVAGNLDILQVQPALSVKTLPLGQVTEDIALEWEDPIITRFNRRRQVAIQASPHGGTFFDLYFDVDDKFEDIELPDGYDIMWDGEFDSVRQGVMSLIPGMLPGVTIMVLIMVALFNSVRQPIILALTVPFALIGITTILAGTQTAFGFMALLGAMSLMGLMIKNGIVLLDEIEANKAMGLSPYDSTVGAGMSRVRPVVLGAATTILGVIPLVQDVFWVGMAYTIMFGLLFGTVLTMILVPVLYAMLYRVKSPPAD